MALAFKSVDEFLKMWLSDESYHTELSCGDVDYAVTENGFSLIVLSLWMPLLRAMFLVLNLFWFALILALRTTFPTSSHNSYWSSRVTSLVSLEVWQISSGTHISVKNCSQMSRKIVLSEEFKNSRIIFENCWKLFRLSIPLKQVQLTTLIFLCTHTHLKGGVWTQKNQAMAIRWTFQGIRKTQRHCITSICSLFTILFHPRVLQ